MALHGDVNMLIPANDQMPLCTPVLSPRLRNAIVSEPVASQAYLLKWVASLEVTSAICLANRFDDLDEIQPSVTDASATMGGACTSLWAACDQMTDRQVRARTTAFLSPARGLLQAGSDVRPIGLTQPSTSSSSLLKNLLFKLMVLMLLSTGNAGGDVAQQVQLIPVQDLNNFQVQFSLPGISSSIMLSVEVSIGQILVTSMAVMFVAGAYFGCWMANKWARRVPHVQQPVTMASVGTMSQTTYSATLHWQTPRFRVLPETHQGVFP